MTSFIHFKGTVDDAKVILPIELKSLKDATEECLRNARDSEKEFEQVTCHAFKIDISILW